MPYIVMLVNLLSNIVTALLTTYTCTTLTDVRPVPD